MLIDKLQELTEQTILPDWDKLQHSMYDHAKAGNSTFTFYDKDYMRGNEFSSNNVYKDPIFSALVEKCKSEGLNPKVCLLNNAATGVTSATVSW